VREQCALTTQPAIEMQDFNRELIVEGSGPRPGMQHLIRGDEVEAILQDPHTCLKRPSPQSMPT
jgi:hypothetical protein